MLDIKVRKVGNSLGVVFPKEVLSRLNVQNGDKVFLTEASDGSYRITPYPMIRNLRNRLKSGKNSWLATAIPCRL